MYDIAFNVGLRSFRAARLIPACSLSQSPNNTATEDEHEILEERSELRFLFEVLILGPFSRPLSKFSFSTSAKEEVKILSEIAWSFES